MEPLIEALEKDGDVVFDASHGDRAALRFRWGILDGDVHYYGYERNIEVPAKR